MNYTPKEEAQLLVDEANRLAKDMLADMDGDECVDMVRSFCAAMCDWQPNIAENLHEPVMLGLHCLAAAQLFRLAFLKAYENTDKRIKATEAIKKALGDLS